MGVRILHDEENAMAALLCGTTERAFGPVFRAENGRTAEDRAECFQRWLQFRSSWPMVITKGPFARFDVRMLTDEQLERAFSEWLAQEAEQVAAEEREAKDALEAERAAIDDNRDYYAALDEARQHPERFA